MKKKLLSLLVMICMAFSICLVGCGEKGLDNNPATNATVISNGGMSVVKGDYLYFVNGYVDETTLTKDDNKQGEITKGAIYRTKLDNGEIVKDKDGFLLADRTDRVVSKIVGFGNGGFAIMGDYIYYGTPYMKLDKDGILQNNRVEFHRVGIDGLGDEVIYVTTAPQDNLNWKVYNIGGTVYLVLFENDKIISVNTSSGDVVGSVESPSSYAILDEELYQHDADRSGFLYNNIIYTRSIDSNDKVFNYKGNAVCAFNIATGESTTLSLNISHNINIQHVTPNTVYYTKVDSTNSSDIACLYKRVITSSWSSSQEVQLTNLNYDAYYFVGYGNDLIIATRDEATWRLEGDCKTGPTKVLTAKRDVLAIYDNYGYYVVDGDLIRFDINGVDILEEVFGNVTTLISSSNYIDSDDSKIYTYGLYTAENGDTNYYLSYFDKDCTSETFVQRFVGVFEEGDVPAKPEQPEPEYEGDEVEYIPHID